MYHNHRIAVLIPVLNEQASIAKVIAEIPGFVDQLIVADNGSIDKTVEIAESFGATTTFEPTKGYGATCLEGLKKVENNTDIIVFIDGDYSDFPAEMGLLLDKIVYHDYDVVIGSRMLLKDSQAVLLPVARFGNWLSTKLIAFFWKEKFTDLGPFRAIKWQKFLELEMQDRNFGWTVELQIKASKLKFKCTEVPVSYRNRIGKSKVSGTFVGSFKAGCKILYLIFRELF